MTAAAGVEGLTIFITVKLNCCIQWRSHVFNVRSNRKQLLSHNYWDIKEVDGLTAPLKESSLLRLHFLWVLCSPRGGEWEEELEGWERMCGIRFLFCSSELESWPSVITVVLTRWRTADSSAGLLSPRPSPRRAGGVAGGPPWPSRCWREPSPGWEAKTEPEERRSPK